MKIREIKISNVLSFGPKDDFDNCPADITFGENLNIIVGSNGSGKSNFVEIIFTLFQSYFLEPYSYNYSYETDRINNPTYLTKRNDAGTNLRLNKHTEFETKESLISLKLKIGESDKKNIQFLKDNLEKLDEIIREFLPGFPILSSIPFSEIDVNSINEVTFKFIVSNTNKLTKVNFNLVTEQGNIVQSVVNAYLKDFDLYRKLVEIGIAKKRYDWENLNVSFEFLGSHRLVGSFPTSVEFSPGQENKIGSHLFQKKNQNIKTNSDTSSMFGMTNAKIGSQIRKDSRSNLTLEQAVESQFTEPTALFYKLNTLLKEYLDLSIRHQGIPSINLDTLNVEIYKYASGKRIDFEQLSSGQKSIFTLIFLVVTSELENGFLMIDEPEIHLHPNLQRKYFQLLKDFSTDFNLQSILVTHSPVFIDEKTIKTTYRFYINDGKTNIIKGENITSPDEELIKFLSYTNSSKIFFTNKVILVEGDTDSYFFTYLLNNHIKTSEEVEFLAIGGKGNYKKWFDFLDKFKIKRYFITDFDFLDDPEFTDLGIQEVREQLASQGLTPGNVVQAKITPPQTPQQVQEASNAIFDGFLSKALADITESDLITLRKAAFLQRVRKTRFVMVTEELEKTSNFKENIETTIVNLRTKDTYVLRWGDLEDYLALHNKGLQNVVDYCTNSKYTTIESKFKLDLEYIFKEILAK